MTRKLLVNDDEVGLNVTYKKGGVIGSQIFLKRNTGAPLKVSI